MPTTHYSTLGLSSSATDADVKAAYRRLALETHPDKGGDAERFKAVAAAYATLSDPSARAAYDAELSRPADAPYSSPTAAWPRSAAAHASRADADAWHASAHAWPHAHAGLERDLDFAHSLFREVFGSSGPFAGVFGGAGGARLDPFGARFDPFADPFGDAFPGSAWPFGARSPLGLLLRADPFAGGGATVMSSSTASSWSSAGGGGPARAVSSSSSWEGGVRVTRRVETLRHADGRVETLRDETTYDDGRGNALPAPPSPPPPLPRAHEARAPPPPRIAAPPLPRSPPAAAPTPRTASPRTATPRTATPRTAAHTPTLHHSPRVATPALGYRAVASAPTTPASAAYYADAPAAYYADAPRAAAAPRKYAAAAPPLRPQRSYGDEPSRRG
jgi:hypothetical protein